MIDPEASLATVEPLTSASLPTEEKLAKNIPLFSYKRSKHENSEGEAPSGLNEGGHELFQSSVLIGPNGRDGDAELLPTRPANRRPVDEYGRMLAGQKDT